MSTWFIGLLIATQAGNDSILQEPDLVQRIREKQLKRIAICPNVFQHDPLTGEDSFASLGPQGEKASRDFYQALEKLAAPNGFTFVSANRVRDVFKQQRFRTSDLADQSKLKALGVALHADGLIFIQAPDESKAFGDVSEEMSLWKFDLFSLKTGEISWGTGSELLTPQYGISDVAYSGKSFELRRWNGNRLEPIGFQADLGAIDAVGMGLGYEMQQFVKLRPDLVHPLRDPKFPYQMKIRACGPNGEKGALRDLEWIGGQPHVRLEPGEHFEVLLTNKSSRNTLMALYIDGVNTINEIKESPLQTPPNRRWAVASKKEYAIRGWTRVTPGQISMMNRFRMGPIQDAVGFEQRVTDTFGMITLVVYTNGIDGIVPSPREAPKNEFKGPEFYAVGRAKEAEAQQLTFVDANAGLMLAAMTIHYRSGAELEERKQKALQLAANVGDVNTTDTGSARAKSGNGVVTSTVPGEEVLYIAKAKQGDKKDALPGEDVPYVPTQKEKQKRE